MKFFSWMQDKINGRQGSNKTNKLSTPSQAKLEPREEFRDWPHGLLAIGTFGNNESKETKETPQDLQENPSPPEDLSEFTPEDVGNLQKELTKLLSSRKSASKTEKEITDLPLDRFLNCPSTLDVDRRISNSLCSNSDDNKDDIDIERTISVIIRKCKEISADSGKKKSISKKSISFLLKKMFVCSSGFIPTPSLRDNLQDQESRMEKLLRTMLLKKMHPRNSSRASSVKKYLEGKANLKAEEEEDRQGRDNDSKWVKTDSEYIVLEI